MPIRVQIMLRWIAVLAIAASLAAPTGAWAEDGRGRGGAARCLSEPVARVAPSGAGRASGDGAATALCAGVPDVFDRHLDRDPSVSADAEQGQAC